MKRLLFILLSLNLLTGCSSVDSTANDLKSPCVANDNGSGKNPCVRRSLLANYAV